MRDVLILLIVVGSLPVTLMRPWIGILVFSWISYMNPHRLSWGFAYDMPFALVISLTTMSACLVSNDPERRFAITATTVLLMSYVLWTCVTTLFALNPADATVQWISFLKIQLMTFFTLLLITNKIRIQMFIWIVVISLGFYGIKGGIFGAMSGGNYRFWGPPGTFIEDNNQLALALVMTVPLMYFLYQHAPRQWLKLGMLGAMVLTLGAILITYSRGGLIALFVMSLVLWLRGRRRLLLGVSGSLAIGLLISFMPAQWMDRMNSVTDYSEDNSANQRFGAWLFSINVVQERPITGGGFKVHQSKALYMKYNPEAARLGATAHSIYFEVLGEHGWVGLLLFVLLWISGFKNCGWVRSRTRKLEEHRWAFDLASMIQVSMVGYAVNGALLNLATFDLYYHLIVITIVMRAYIARQLADDLEQPAWMKHVKQQAEPIGEAAQEALTPAPAEQPAPVAKAAHAPPNVRLGGASGFMIKKK